MEYDVDDYDALLEPLRSCEVGFVLACGRTSTAPGACEISATTAGPATS